MSMNKEKLDDLRKVMGTLPDENPEMKTPFLKGVEGMKVALIDFPTNPYKAFYTLATSCWGKKIDKWRDTSFEGRVKVVEAVLKRSALPLAYESVSFTFAIDDISRWAFDQIARARIGAVFSSMGSRDNNHCDAGFRIANEIWEDSELLEKYKNALLECKNVYSDIVNKGTSSWQTARDILPISNLHRFSMTMNFAALQNFCAKRMRFCEADQVVAVAWLIREEVKKKFPLLAMALRPGCDFSKKCDYHSTYYLSEVFGCLFKECGRNECKNVDGYSTFNNSCSDKKVIEKQLNIKIPNKDEETLDEYLENISESDLKLLCEN